LNSGWKNGWRTIRFSPDLWIVIAVFVTGAVVGGLYWRAFVASGVPQEFAQQEFGAAVALTCGYGFRDPGYAPTPEVRDFLLRKRDRITCADLPPNLITRPANFSQGLYRYLLSAAALVWTLSGFMSWNGLTPMFAVAYGWTLAAAYGLFRLGIGRVMSLLASFALLVSAVHLGYLPYFRDYAKAPFILTLILIMARLAMRPITWRRALTFGAAFGIVLGIGFGFRNDILINIVPWAAVVVLCLPGRLFSNLKLKAACLAVSAAVFVVAAWPILTAYSRGSNSGHVTFLGLMTAFNAPIGVDGSIYDWGYFYNDGFANRLINSFTYRQFGHRVEYVTPEYDRAMFVYIFKIVRHWPADFVARAYGSTLRMLDELPFAVGAYHNPTPLGIHHPTVLAFYQWQMSVLRSLNGIGAPAVALALLVISARSVRTALTLLAFLLYFAGYPAIQFSVRHFFHLEFIAWWALAFLIGRAAIVLWVLGRRAVGIRPAAEWQAGPAARRVGTFAVAGVVLVVGPLLALRWYQSAHVRTLLEDSYLGAEREPLAVAKTAGPGGRMRMDLPTLWSGRNPNEETSTEYIVAEFSPRNCGSDKVAATFRYNARDENADFSHKVSVPISAGDQSTLVFFPALYDEVYAQFGGIELAAADANCLAGVERVRKDRIPEVLLDLTFTPHWRDFKLYQTLAKLEAPPGSAESLPPEFTNPSPLTLPVRSRVSPFVLPTPASEYRTPIVSVSHPDGSFVIKGRPDSPYSQVLVLKDQRLPTGAIVIARGNVRKGGITFGLQREGFWVNYVNISARGEFVGAVAVPADGDYWVALSNLVEPGWIEGHVSNKRLAEFLLSRPFLRPENDVVIHSLGWAAPQPAAGEAIQ
jgi:hypothetical protein